MTFDFDAPRTLVWDFLTNPALRPLWVDSVNEVREQTRATRRRGAGTTNHCMHGDDIQIEEILSWHAKERLTAKSTFPDPRIPPVVVTNILTDLPGDRTRFEIRLRKPDPEDLEAADTVIDLLAAGMSAGATVLGKLVAAEAIRLAEGRTSEPVLPKTAGRFASEPVHVHKHHKHDAPA